MNTEYPVVISTKTRTAAVINGEAETGILHLPRSTFNDNHSRGSGLHGDVLVIGILIMKRTRIREEMIITLFRCVVAIQLMRQPSVTVDIKL